MLFIVVILSLISLPLLVATLRHTCRMPLDVHVRRWTRCAVCGAYQNTTEMHCPNHDQPVPLLNVDERRIHYHTSYLWTYPQIKRHQDRFVAFTMRLEDLSADDWTTEAAIMIYKHIGPLYLYKFVEFLLGMEEAAGTRLDVEDVVTQFLVAEEMQDDTQKIAQN